MTFFCHQVSYTTDARKRLLSNSDDRYEAIRAPIEKLGGTLKSSFFTLGPFDVLVISEFPQDISPAEISVAFYEGGTIASIHTYSLLPLPEAADSETSASRRPMRRAALAAAHSN
jgi:uncharacterized protein with GYD domain